MKPIKLTMQSFGPFAEKCEIDFEDLYSDGVYLITGDTGSGKTTVFDAVTFALYGGASGENRKEKMFRSKYAADSSETYVELDFVHGGKFYSVRRTPTYTLPNRKTPVANTARLTLPDGEVIEGIKEVTDRISEILKINKDQFRQTSMLAQGDFQKLLFSTTRDRQEIFRKIFNTQNYEKLQERINLRFRELKNENSSLESKMNIYVSNVKTERELSFSEEIQNRYDDELFEKLDGIINSDKEMLSALEKMLTKAESDLNHAEKLLMTAEENEKINKGIGEANEELSALETKFRKIKEEYSLIPQMQEKLSDIQSRYISEEKDLVRYDELENMTILLSSLVKQGEENEKAVNKNTELLSSQRSHAEKLKEEYEKIKDCEIKKAEVLSKKALLSSEKAEYETIAKTINEYSAYVKKMSVLAKEVKEHSDKLTAVNSEYISAHARFLGSQAGLLASVLEDGKPCPVCGSKHHPSPAKADEQSPSKEDLDRLDEELSVIRESSQKKNSEFETVKAVAARLLNDITEKTSSLSDGNISEIKLRLKEKYDEVSSSLKETETKINVFDKQISRKKQLEREVPEAEDSILKTERLINDLLLVNAELKAKTEAAEKNIISLKEELAYEDKQTALRELKNLSSLKESYEEKIRNIRSDYTETDKSIVSVKARIESDKKKIKVIDEDISDIRKKNDEALEEKKRLTEKINSVNVRIISNSDAKKSLKATYKKLLEVRKAYGDYSALDEVFSGKITQKDKIELETFIQMRYFDRVLEKANTRFLIMSSSRYELRRKITASSKRSSSGLDLEVIDHYNGTSRDVATLSGGELFLAALCLALGLSDEVQESAGNVRIDALFVDEGFGSLDSHSLSQVMKVINSLSSPERPVAIISHVEELKNIIDRKIVVSKSVSGSTLRIE